MNNDLAGIHAEDLAGYRKDKPLREGLGGVYHFLPAFFAILFAASLALTFLEQISFGPDVPARQCLSLAASLPS